MSLIEEPLGDEPTIADVDKLTAWLDAQGLGVGAPLEHQYISGGSQNEIYELRRGDLHGAMRIPPTSAPASRDDGIVREWRIIEALSGTNVPHTEALAVEPGGQLLDVGDRRIVADGCGLFGHAHRFPTSNSMYWPYFACAASCRLGNHWVGQMSSLSL